MRDLLVIHVHAGNVILPGIFLAFLLRFDTSYGRPRRPFFHLTLLAYAVCLALSVSASEAGASPVEIVYLVPACLGMAAFVGACLREFAAFATYTEEKPRPRSRDHAASRRKIIAYLLMCVYRSQTPWYFSCRAELLAFPLGLGLLALCVMFASETELPALQSFGFVCLVAVLLVCACWRELGELEAASEEDHDDPRRGAGVSQPRPRQRPSSPRSPVRRARRAASRARAASPRRSTRLAARRTAQ